MKLEDLRRNWLELTPEEKLEIVKEVRMSRITPERRAEKKKAERKAKKKSINLKKLIDNLDETELDELIKKLEGLYE